MNSLIVIKVNINDQIKNPFYYLYTFKKDKLAIN
jgi:hypothetical protein